MKNIKYLFNIVLVLMLFTACDPNEDINDAIDANIASELKEEKELQDYYNLRTLAEATYTLTNADYALSSNSNVAKYTNFSESAVAGDLIPEIIDSLFYGVNTQEMRITYNYYRGSHVVAGTYSEITEYTLTTADYDAMGEDSREPGRYDNFSSSTAPNDYLPDFLLIKYPNIEDGSLIEVTYDYYVGSGVSEERKGYYILNGTTWVPVYKLTNSDYSSMEIPGGYSNFSSNSAPEDYLPVFIGIRFPYENAGIGDEKAILYEYYEGDNVTTTRIGVYVFDGSAWAKYPSVIEKSDLFSYDTKNWKFIPAIKFIETTEAATKTYEIKDADYELVGNGQYHNFDEEIEVVISKITTILKASSDLELAIGDIFDVTYVYYDGSKTTKTITLEAVEDI